MINHPVNQSKIIWREKLPAVIVALLSVFEMILTLTVVGCHIGGDFVDFQRMNIFIVYWTFPIFMCAWISLSGAGCCCRIRCCSITALVFQCLAIPFALSLIGLDTYILNHPTECFFQTVAIRIPHNILITVYAITQHCMKSNYRVRKVMHYQNSYSTPTGVMPSTNQQVTKSTNQKYAVPLDAGYATPSIINPPIASHSDAHIRSRTVPMNHIVCPNCQSMFKVTT
ncbi:unnamed protein product [Rotaria magnacalcarata]|uniref:Uncharacterized protein n=1 Tax=Rotaria magnacalcarata TaxID=392030 RepID=A0A819HLX8_9BILA|nr:unnamed protein product [Rotaria magnacalcarata]